MEVYPKTLFEPDDCRKSEDRYYSKSNQNFFSTGKNSNINFIDENFCSGEDIQAELDQINTKNRKNRYLDSDSLPITENDLK